MYSLLQIAIRFERQNSRRYYQPVANCVTDVQCMEKVIYAVRMNGERVDPPYKPPSQGTGNPVRLLLAELQQPEEPSKGEPLLILFQFVF